MALRILDHLRAAGPALDGLHELLLLEATPGRLVARGGETLFLVLEGRFDLASPATLRRSPVNRLTLSRDRAGRQALLRLDGADMPMEALPEAGDGLLAPLLQAAARAGPASPHSRAPPCNVAEGGPAVSGSVPARRNVALRLRAVLQRIGGRGIRPTCQ